MGHYLVDFRQARLPSFIHRGMDFSISMRASLNGIIWRTRNVNR